MLGFLGLSRPWLPRVLALALLLSVTQAPRKVRWESFEKNFVITDPEVLLALEAHGAGLGFQLGLPKDQVSNNKNFLQIRNYRLLLRQLREDILAEQDLIFRAPDTAGRYATLFDFAWLLSPEAHFELVAVVNRLDRLMFSDASNSNCGELRFVYRLAYEAFHSTNTLASRLPMTLVLIHHLPQSKEDPGCRLTANALRIPRSSDLVSQLLSSQSPFSSMITHARSFESLEINVQISRWPAFEESSFAERTHYLMRAFKVVPASGLLAAIALENTPDVLRLQRDTKLREQLLAFLSRPETLRAIARGNLHLPEEFLANKAVSVAPFGLDRMANRPFSQVFSERDFSNLDSKEGPFAHAATLLRRLDSLSCIGCHQSFSVAGLHLVGEERDRNATFNALASPLSPYLEATIPWRAQFLERIAEGGAFPDLPTTERGLKNFGGYGARCGEPGSGFADWTCKNGLHCYSNFPSTQGGLGHCYPESLGAVGDPCESRHLQGSSDSLFDTLEGDRVQSCKDGGTCSLRTHGFPGGSCVQACDVETQPEVCHRVPNLLPFSICLAKKGSFRACFEKNFSYGELPSCGEGIGPCREDYVCARVRKGRGFCMPTYFVPQLNIEHQPSLSM